jgi:hypothetical protein
MRRPALDSSARIDKLSLLLGRQSLIAPHSKAAIATHPRIFFAIGRLELPAAKGSGRAPGPSAIKAPAHQFHAEHFRTTAALLQRSSRHLLIETRRKRMNDTFEGGSCFARVDSHLLDRPGQQRGPLTTATPVNGTVRMDSLVLGDSIHTGSAAQVQTGERNEVAKGLPHWLQEISGWLASRGALAMIHISARLARPGQRCGSKVHGGKHQEAKMIPDPTAVSAAAQHSSRVIVRQIAAQ